MCFETKLSGLPFCKIFSGEILYIFYGLRLGRAAPKSHITASTRLFMESGFCSQPVYNLNLGR